MSWAEFMVRCDGFKRVREYEQMMFREVAYSAFVSGWMGKQKPPSKEKFWPIGNKKPKVTDRMREKFLAAKEKYNKEKEKRGGGS